MTDLDLEQLKHIDPPKAREKAKRLAMESAMSAFDKQSNRNTVGQLLDKINSLLSYIPVPSRAAGALASTVLVVAVATAMFYQYTPPTPERLAEKETADVDDLSKGSKQKEKPKLRGFAAPQPSQSLDKNIRHFRRREAKKSYLPANVFRSPLQGTLPLHYCRSEDKECGKVVADQYCKSKGFDKAATFSKSKSTPKSSASIDGSKVFKKETGSTPITFEYINCAK